MADDARQQRALALVAAKRKSIKHVSGARWLVPSATNPTGGYVVDADAGTCSCPDHEERGVKCKHIYAVLLIRQEVSLPDGSTVTTTVAAVATATRITYRQDWPAYNAAQCEEGHRVQLLLRALCDGIVQPPYTGRGRRPALLADVVLSNQDMGDIGGGWQGVGCHPGSALRSGLGASPDSAHALPRACPCYASGSTSARGDTGRPGVTSRANRRGDEKSVAGVT